MVVVYQSVALLVPLTHRRAVRCYSLLGVSILKGPSARNEFYRIQSPRFSWPFTLQIRASYERYKYDIMPC
jgi:hypothetical protein